MTPLQAVARALVLERNKTLPVTDAPIDWEYISRDPENEWYRFYMGQARAALLALAEFKLPDRTTRLALMLSGSDFPKGRLVNLYEGYRIEFKAMLRAIATEGNPDDAS
jgi:hypothetical protein